MADNFWTDAKVKEFVRGTFNYGVSLDDAMNNFKQSKTQVSRDWEVESFYFPSDKENPFVKEIDGKYKRDLPTRHTLQQMMSEENYKKGIRIHSVRRLSDQVVFSVGDEVESSEFKLGKSTITSFAILNDNGNERMMAGCFSGGIEIVALKKVEKPIPLFVTEDDFQLYEGDKCALLSTDSWLISYPVTAPKNPFCGDNGQFKYFSTKEVAEEYILNHKPLLSLEDVFSVCEKVDEVHWEGADDDRDCEVFYTEKLKELAKSKLNTK
jgi:hypothetical protein